ncbi:MAG: shikimate kinase AroK [Gammaproteobacteria bacterium]
MYSLRSDLVVTKAVDNIFLVGPMGAGKSSIGMRLARQLRWPFWDTDKEIERRTGVDISTIFEYEGEDGFRDREALVIDELTRQRGIVLATGGGAVLRRSNREQLSTRGFVVYLRVSIKHQLRRTARDRKRPILQTGPPREVLESLAQARNPFYEEVADYIVDTDRNSMTLVINTIAREASGESGGD